MGERETVSLRPQFRRSQRRPGRSEPSTADFTCPIVEPPHRLIGAGLSLFCDGETSQREALLGRRGHEYSLPTPSDTYVWRKGFSAAFRAPRPGTAGPHYGRVHVDARSVRHHHSVRRYCAG